METKLQRRVVCAAIRNRVTQQIICGARHYDAIMRQQIQACAGWFRRKTILRNWRRAEQGFIDNHGVFMTREEALALALETQQRIRRCGGDTTRLYSENLY